MNHRETILGRIRQALSDRPNVETPPVFEVWPDTNPGQPAMLERFAEELGAVDGELHRCDSIDVARAKLAELAKESKWTRLGVVDRPLVHELANDFSSGDVSRIDDNTDKTTIGQLDASIVGAELLLADTGTCLIECRTASERMMCYLPPVCIVVARAESLREHLPAAWREVTPRASESERRGEFVLITGPSRTADIEKILILGVHGPKRLIVLVVE